MDIKNVVTNQINKAIDLAPVNSELKQAAHRNKNRITLFTQKLYQEVLRVEAIRKAKGKKSLKRHTIESLVNDMVGLYLTGIEAEANRRTESDLARIKREMDLQRQKDIEATEQGSPQGDYEAMAKEGLQLGETKTYSLE